MIDGILSDTEEGMTKAIERFKSELAKVRTGRANLSLLDNVKIDYYGTPTPLNQVASLNVADARLITIKPWEKTNACSYRKGDSLKRFGAQSSD